MTAIITGGECPKCGADISAEDINLPCWDCGAQPPPDSDLPTTYTLYYARPSELHGAPVGATFATVNLRDAYARARRHAEGINAPVWTLLADAGTSHTRFVCGNITPIAREVSGVASSGVAPDDEAERESEDEARNRLFGQPHHGHDTDDLI